MIVAGEGISSLQTAARDRKMTGGRRNERGLGQGDGNSK